MYTQDVSRIQKLGKNMFSFEGLVVFDFPKEKKTMQNTRLALIDSTQIYSYYTFLPVLIPEIYVLMILITCLYRFILKNAA